MITGIFFAAVSMPLVAIALKQEAIVGRRHRMSTHLASKGWVHANYKLEGGIAMRAAEYVYPAGVRLFDLESDIGEREDLAGKRPAVVAELKGIYEQWRSEMGEPRSGKVKKRSNKKASKK